MIELFKDTLTDNLHPVGKMEFYRGLVDINVKNTYIKHAKNKALIAFIGTVYPILHSVLTVLLCCLGVLPKILWAHQRRSTHDHHSHLHAYQQH